MCSNSNITFEEVSKFYTVGNRKIFALRDMSFEIEKGELCVIVGPSGAGKTTLLNILGGMDTADRGKVCVYGRKINELDAKKLTEYRRSDVGFVFQFYNLVQNLTAIENIELASEISLNPLDCERVIAQVGLTERKNNFPAQLSGGEQQRVAIARAIAKNPRILLCDEPTGALDYNTGKSILKLLQNTSKETGKTIIIITHNQAIVPMADRVIKIKNGAAKSVEINKNPIPVERIEW